MDLSKCWSTHYGNARKPTVWTWTTHLLQMMDRDHTQDPSIFVTQALIYRQTPIYPSQSRSTDGTSYEDQQFGTYGSHKIASISRRNKSWLRSWKGRYGSNSSNTWPLCGRSSSHGARRENRLNSPPNDSSNSSMEKTDWSMQFTKQNSRSRSFCTNQIEGSAGPGCVG